MDWSVVFEPTNCGFKVLGWAIQEFPYQPQHPRHRSRWPGATLRWRNG
jgi:hypothetical protein